MFDKIKYLYEVTQAGKQLADPDIWAHRANLQAVFVAILTGGLGLANAFGYHIEVSGTDIQGIALGFATFSVLLVSYLHTASNKDAGRKGGVSSEG